MTYWSYAAWSLPFAALAAIVLSYFVGYETWFDKILIAIITVFFGTSVFWWWWALRELSHLVHVLEETAVRIGLVKNDIKKIREDIFKNDSHRKR